MGFHSYNMGIIVDYISKLTLSALILAGIVMINLYPREAAIKAKAIPVLPLVGSINVVNPGRILPSFSASTTMEYPILSLTEAAGLKYSSFTAETMMRINVCCFAQNLGIFHVLICSNHENQVMQVTVHNTQNIKSELLMYRLAF